jgi:hypothetical protein
MFGSDVLDVGIGMSLLFLMMSLIATAVREAIEGYMKSRSSDLEKGLREMFDERKPGDFSGLVGTLYNHPLISSLYRDTLEKAQKKGLPSYIPSKTFVAALLDIVLTSNTPAADKTAAGKTVATEKVTDTAETSDAAKAAEKAADPAGVADATDPHTPRLTVAALRSFAIALPNQRLSQVMLTAIDGAKDDVDVVRKNLEGWFDGTMDRVSGWYRRRTQTILFVIGIVAAILLNVDSITIASRLTSDKTLREAIVATAKPQSTATGVGTPKTYDQLATELGNIGYPIGWKGLLPEPQMCKPVPAAKPADAAAPKPDDAVGKPDDSIPYAAYKWFKKTFYETPGCTLDVSVLPRTIAGWFVTAFAIMLGAPFWFDVLNKFMVVRSTIKPSEKSGNEASKDNPAQQAPLKLLLQQVPAPAGLPPDNGDGK